MYTFQYRPRWMVKRSALSQLHQQKTHIFILRTIIKYFYRSIRVNWEEQMAASATSFERRNTTLANNSTDSLNDTIAAASNDTDQTIVSIAPVGDMDAAATRTYYMVTYAVIMAVATVVYLFRSFAFFKLCLRVSINLHDKLFRGISRAKMLFYNTNPSGRILNRFARDISNVDSLLPMVLIDCIDVSILITLIVHVI